MKTVRWLAIPAALMLASCIDGREEYWLHADGSGRAELTYDLPASAARLQGGEAGLRSRLESLLGSADGITPTRCEVTPRGDRLVIRVAAAFRSVRDFKKATPSVRSELPASATAMAGEISLNRHGRTLDLSRTVAPGRALAGSMFMPASQFKDRSLTYIVHLPVAASASNATRTSDGGRTLTWEFPLAQAVKAPVTTRFSAKIPLPQWLVPALAGAALLGAGLAWTIVRRRRS